MDEETQLSRTSAGWALVAIALNTMLFQAGDIPGIPRKWAFFYRASPVICVSATFDSLSQLAMYSFQQRSIQEDLARWMINRSVQRDARLVQSSTGSTPAIIIFFIGVLSQAFKICATKNAGFTQLLCTAYLANYVIGATIIGLAGKFSSSTSSAFSQTRGDGQIQALLTVFLYVALILVAPNVLSYKMIVPFMKREGDSQF